MFYLKNIIIFSLISVLRQNSSYTLTENEIIIILTDFANDKAVQFSDSGAYWSNNNQMTGDGQVDVKLYYECLCPDCMKFDKEQFSVAVEKLSQYVDFKTYPYGNARTVKENGSIEFECQHGPPECYGNKLHACAIDIIQNNTEAFLYNSCMMGGEDRGSNDAAADRCGASFGIDSTPIKACANGDRGTELLEHYGEESQKANFSYVPYILIDGKENDGSNFLRDICAAFAVSPPPCVEYTVPFTV